VAVEIVAEAVAVNVAVVAVESVAEAVAVNVAVVAEIAPN
jgi:hypothetical protein